MNVGISFEPELMWGPAKPYVPDFSGTNKEAWLFPPVLLFPPF
jgi:hypothetical protein